MNTNSIRPLLERLAQGQSDEESYIIAASINLYIESLRRVDGRILLTPKDIPSLFHIVDLLLNPPKSLSFEGAQARSAESVLRSRVPSEEEKIGLLNAVDRAVREDRRE